MERDCALTAKGFRSFSRPPEIVALDRIYLMIYAHFYFPVLSELRWYPNSLQRRGKQR
jgi:hypothetical protein